MDSDRRRAPYGYLRANELEAKTSKVVVGDTAIKFMAELSERVRSSSGRSLEDLIDLQTEWYKKVNPSPPVPFAYDPSRSKADSDELRRAHEMREILDASYLVLRRLTDCVAHQLDGCMSQIDALHSRTAFSSLPDEILSIVLEYAAYLPEASGYEKPNSIINSVKAAIKISSVCSHFRRIAIHSPKLWNRICLGMSQDMLTACVERAASTELEIFFDMLVYGVEPKSPREKLIHPFMEFMMSFVGTWRRFDYQCFPNRVELSSFPEVEMGKLETRTRNLLAPQLRELVVRYEDGVGDCFQEGDHDPDVEFDFDHWRSLLHYYSTWNLPSLQSMSTVNIIPIRFAGCASIETLSIDMDYGANVQQSQPSRPFDANGLLAFLSSCPALQKLTLRLTWAMMPTRGQIAKHVNLENVKEFNLQVQTCCCHTLEYIMDAIRFTRATTMAFTVVPGKGFRAYEDNFQSHRTISAVLSNTDAFPRLEELHFTVQGEYLTDFPIHNMSNLKHLSLHVWGGYIEPFRREEVLAIPSRLQSIYIDNCWGEVEEWVGCLLRSIEAQGRLDDESLQISVRNVAWKDDARVTDEYTLTRDQLYNAAKFE